jgi:hypothetical protein
LNSRPPGLVVSTTVELGAFSVRLGSEAGAALEPIRPSRPRLRAPEAGADQLVGEDIPGRESDLTQIRARLAAPGTRAVVIHGASGIGKSSLLAALASDPRIRETCAGGLFALNARHQTADSAAHALFRRLEEAGAPPRTPSEAEIRQGLAACDALVVLDDVAPGFSLATFLHLAPRVTAILASPVPLAADGAVAYPLEGLEEAEAVRLLARDLDPWSDERAVCRALCTLLEGNPGRIRQLVPHAAAMGWRLGELAVHLQGPPDFDATRLAEIAFKLDREQCAILDAAALFGEPALCGGGADDPAYADFAELEKRRLLVREGGRRKLATGLAASLESQLRHPEVLDAALDWFDARFASYGAEMTGDGAHRADLAEGLRRLAACGRPAAVVRFGRAFSDSLAANLEWRAWEDTVSYVAVAAAMLDDRAAQAWAHHQIGVHALATGERNIAREALKKALAERELLHDEPGAALTRAQLALLGSSRLAGARLRNSRTGRVLAGLLLLLTLGADLHEAVASYAERRAERIATGVAASRPRTSSDASARTCAGSANVPRSATRRM